MVGFVFTLKDGGGDNAPPPKKKKKIRFFSGRNFFGLDNLDIQTFFAFISLVKI